MTNPPECHDEVCITCSDSAVAVTIVHLLDDGLALVDTGQGEEEVSVALVSAGVGDTILVHAKEAISVVPSEAEGRLEAPRRRAGAQSEPGDTGR